MDNPNILSGEDVGMILLGKEIQILNLQKALQLAQQQVERLTRTLEEKNGPKPGQASDEPIPFPRKKN